VEAAWQGVYRSPTIRAYFERVLHGRPERHKIALVATAHYLLRCMHAMLVRGRPWHEAA
jgi:transposase